MGKRSAIVQILLLFSPWLVGFLTAFVLGLLYRRP